jgi:conjugal transfer mating pair stabilization protein TraG
MGTLDVITFGGGENYRDVFIGVALMTGTGAMGSLVRVALLLGLIWGLLRMMGDLNPGRVLKWFITAAIMYGCLFVPKVDVRIIDKFNPALPGALVGNVPLGVGFAESLASQIGARMVDMTETAFGDPAELQYSKTGMIFGAKFMEAATRARFTDQTYETNLEAFFKNCVFYDITDNQYTPDDLAKTNDLWGFLQAHTPNPARMTPFISGAGAGNVTNSTCTDAFSALQSNRNAKGDESMAAIERRLEPLTPDASLVGNGYGVMGSLLGLTNMASTDAQASIVQIATVNALGGALTSASAASGASNSLAQAQADRQTQNAGALLAHVGENSIVVLKIVIDLLFIGMFPILFPLFLLPSVGLKMLQGYVAGFFYLQLWGPMYVIVHRIIMTSAETQMAAAAAIPGNPNGSGFNMLTLTGINDVNANIQTVAGMMVLMIPVIAGALTKGAMAVGGQGEALLQPFRSGAESAASAQTTGNWNFGNRSIDTESFHNVTGNQVRTSGMLDEGFLTRFDRNHDQYTQDRIGRLVDVRSAGHDSFITADSMRSLEASTSERARRASEVSNAFTTVESQAQQRMFSKIHEAVTTDTHGRDDRTSVSNDRRDGTSEDLSELAQISRDASRTFGVAKDWSDSRVESAARGMSADLGLRGELGVPGISPVSGGVQGGFGGNLNASHQNQRTLSENERNAEDYINRRVHSQGLTSRIDKAQTSLLNQSYADVSSHLHTNSDKTSQGFTSTKGFSQAKERAHRESVSAERTAEATQKLAQNFREDHGSAFQAFFNDWARVGPDNHVRSNSELADLLQGRTPEARGIAQEGMLAYIRKNIPDIERPDDLVQAFKDLPLPASAAQLSAPEPFAHHKAGARQRHEHATPHEPTAAERATAAGLTLPSDDRHIHAGELAGVPDAVDRDVNEAQGRPLPKKLENPGLF